MRQKNCPRGDIPKRKVTTQQRVKPLTLGDLAKQGVTEIEDDCRKLLDAVPRDPAMPAQEQHTAQMHAVKERWPELTASQALFIVRELSR